MRTHRITSSDDVKLHIDDRGPADAPAIVFLHGFCQSAFSWKRQFGGALEERFRLVTPDLRGHGRSDKPRAPESYTQGEMWAGDVAAVIGELGLAHPVLLAWSYSGLIACDFLRFDDPSKLSGLGLISARSMIGTDAAGAMSGSLFHDLLPGFLVDEAEIPDCRYRSLPAILDAWKYPRRRLLRDAGVQRRGARPRLSCVD